MTQEAQRPIGDSCASIPASSAQSNAATQSSVVSVNGISVSEIWMETPVAVQYYIIAETRRVGIRLCPVGPDDIDQMQCSITGCTRTACATVIESNRAPACEGPIMYWVCKDHWNSPDSGVPQVSTPTSPVEYDCPSNHPSTPVAITD